MVKQTKEQSPNKPSKNNSELQDSGLFLDRTGMAGSDNTQTKEQELEKEMKEIDNRLGDLKKEDIKWNRLKAEIKGFQEGKLQAEKEKCDKCIKQFMDSGYIKGKKEAQDQYMKCFDNKNQISDIRKYIEAIEEEARKETLNEVMKITKRVYKKYEEDIGVNLALEELKQKLLELDRKHNEK